MSVCRSTAGGANPPTAAAAVTASQKKKKRRDDVIKRASEYDAGVLEIKYLMFNIFDNNIVVNESIIHLTEDLYYYYYYYCYCWSLDESERLFLTSWLQLCGSSLPLN